MDLKSFFQEQEIDVFADVSIEDLQDKDRSSVLAFLPAARSVIVFGREVPVPVYRMPPNEKTREMLRIAESLENTAAHIVRHLEAEHFSARPVPLYLPVRIEDGRVQGIVRLKHIAMAGRLGSLGKNTVLLTPRFGPRLLLFGVVTSRPVQESKENGGVDTPICTGCGRCIKMCPGGALGLDGVDVFRCQTVSKWVPPYLVPTVKWMLRRKWLVLCMAPLAPWIARTATIRCSLCVTECLAFGGEKQ